MKFLPILLLFLACERSVEPQPPSMTGRWVWSPHLDIIIAQSGDSFSGSGTYASNPCSISGINQNSNVSFVVAQPIINFTATGTFVTNNQIRFYWTGGSPTDDSTPQYLNRQ